MDLIQISHPLRIRALFSILKLQVNEHPTAASNQADSFAELVPAAVKIQILVCPRIN